MNRDRLALHLPPAPLRAARPACSVICPSPAGWASYPISGGGLPLGAVALAAALHPYLAQDALSFSVLDPNGDFTTRVTTTDGALPLDGLADALWSRRRPFEAEDVMIGSTGQAGTLLRLDLSQVEPILHMAEGVVDDVTGNVLAGRLGAALEHLMRGSHQSLDTLAPSPIECTLFDRWRGAPPFYPLRSVDEYIIEGARAQPNLPAVRCGDRALTYRQLLGSAAAMARHLRDRGVSQGDIIPVCLPRSLELVTSLLGIIMAGAAYCAIPPTWPAERVQDIVTDLQAQLLVTDDRLIAERHHLEPVQATSDIAGATEEQIPERNRDLDAPFSVYYTSGSTGRPKGALSTHRAVLRTLLAPRHPCSEPPLHMLSATPLPWDVFTLELWFPLLHHGCCHLIDDAHLTSATLRRQIDAGVNTAWITSSLFNVFVDEDLDAFRGLRQVLTGGERLSPTHVRHFLTHHPDIDLVNGYGPVEASVFLTTHAIEMDDCAAPQGIPVGRPLPATEIIVLRRTADGELLRAALGEVGEIAAAGDGLSPGYMGMGAYQNDERFLLLSLDTEPPLRVYLTGDLGAWRNDGVLTYAGRADRQIKVRGHRVEPGEIEVVALQSPLIRQCLVYPQTDANGRVHGLAAYVVPAVDHFDRNDLFDFLAERLPEYLVPEHVVPLAALPLGAAGKIDPQALPPVGPHTRRHRSSSRIAGDDLRAEAAVVADHVADILGLPAVSSDDDLIALGLDSLGAIRLVARLVQHYGVAPTVVDILTEATPAGVAALIERERLRQNGADSAVAGTEIPLSDTQLQLWLDDLVRPEHRLANLVFLGYRFEGQVDGAKLMDAIRRVVGRHDALRTGIHEDDDGLPVGVDLDVDIALHRISVPSLRERLTDAEISDLAHGYASRVDLAAGPLCVAHLQAAGNETVLVLVVHHACFDGHSEDIFAREVSAAYSGGALPDAPSYRAYAARRAPRPATLDGWVERLRLIRDVSWPDVTTPTSGVGYGQLDVLLNAEDHRRLIETARTRRLTPFTIGLAAFGAAVRTVTGTPRFGIAVPSAGRPEGAWLDAIGHFVRTVVVPWDVDSYGVDAIVAMASTVREALSYQYVPLGDLLRAVGRHKDERSPLFQIQFAWQNTPAAAWDLAGVHATAVDIVPTVPQFEVTLEFWPHRGHGLPGRLEYDPVWVADATVTRLHNSFRDHLSQLMEQTTCNMEP